MKNLFILSFVLLGLSLMSFTAGPKNPVTQSGKTEFTITKDARFSAEEERLFAKLEQKYHGVNSYTARVSSIEFGGGEGPQARLWIFRNKKSTDDRFEERTFAGNGMIGTDPDLDELYAVLQRHTRTR